MTDETFRLCFLLTLSNLRQFYAGRGDFHSLYLKLGLYFKSLPD
jgi:hypothetical protein